MTSADGYTVIRPEDFDFTPPSQGDESRGVMRLSELLAQSRANIWKMPPSSRGRRHLEMSQEEILIVGAPPTVGDAEYL